MPAPWTPSPEEVAEVAPLLLGSGAGALAWWRLRASESARSPAGFEVQQAYRLHTVQALFHEQQLVRVVRRLRAAGVEPLLGKGWAVARHYPETGLRPYGDIDLYLDVGHHAAARRALKGEAVAVDLHVGCAELDDRPWSALHERASSVPLHDEQVKVFGLEDHLRLLGLHLLRHGAWRPLWLCDLAALVEQTGERLDWDRFLEGDPRRTDWARCALLLARDLLGAELSGAPARISGRRLPDWLARTVLRQWGDASFVPQGRRRPMASYLRRPAGLLRGLRSRWPNAVEATVGVRGPFNAMPRALFQLAECVSRTARFALGLPRALRAR